MTVGELKKLIENISDDVHIVIEGYDHSYHYADVELTQAEGIESYGPDRDKYGHLGEYYPGNKYWEESDIVDVLLVR
jgi:hypothetical protein